MGCLKNLAGCHHFEKWKHLKLREIGHLKALKNVDLTPAIAPVTADFSAPRVPRLMHLAQGDRETVVHRNQT